MTAILHSYWKDLPTLETFLMKPTLSFAVSACVRAGLGFSISPILAGGSVAAVASLTESLATPIILGLFRDHPKPLLIAATRLFFMIAPYSIAIALFPGAGLAATAVPLLFRYLGFELLNPGKLSTNSAAAYIF